MPVSFLTARPRAAASRWTLRVSAARFALGAVLLAATVLAGEATGDDSLPAPTASDDFRGQVSYCIGLDLGRRLKADEVDADLGAIVAGLRDALTGADPMLTDDQVQQVMGRFDKLMQQKAQQKMADIAAENLAKGEAFLTENRGKDGIEETPSGLQYRVVEAGDGATPGPTDTVRCHYEGTLIDGTVFDSSYKRGQPAEFPVNGVIAGWTEALQMMQAGAKWEVFLPAKIAYGPRGAGGAIGPNETLIFTIELLAVVD